MDLLAKIVDYKRLELEHLKRHVSLKDTRKMAADTASALGFLTNFAKDSINIIAEFKRASPSAGPIRPDAKAADIAQVYQDAGAKALSILTDEHFFKGCLNDLKEVKAKLKLPVLRKDFTLDEYHIIEARAAGADAVLLIAAILDQHQLKDYNQLAAELGMMALVEVHSQEELEKTLLNKISLLGINNRNLKTLKTDIAITENLYRLAPNDVPVISESGLKTHADLTKLKGIGVTGFLIGEAILKEKDVGAKLRQLCHPE